MAVWRVRVCYIQVSVLIRRQWRRSRLLKLYGSRLAAISLSLGAAASVVVIVIVIVIVIVDVTAEYLIIRTLCQSGR